MLSVRFFSNLLGDWEFNSTNSWDFSLFSCELRLAWHSDLLKLIGVIWAIEQFLSLQRLRNNGNNSPIMIQLLVDYHYRRICKRTKQPIQCTVQNLDSKWTGNICLFSLYLHQTCSRVEFTMSESGVFFMDWLQLLRLVGESSKSICEWSKRSKRRNESSSDVRWAATHGAVGVDVNATLCGWFDVFSRFNLKNENIDANKLMI